MSDFVTEVIEERNRLKKLLEDVLDDWDRDNYLDPKLFEEIRAEVNRGNG